MATRNELKWINTQFNWTAKRLAGWDSGGVAVEVQPATGAEAITGTDDTKPLTSAAAEAKRSVKSVSVSNSAMGTTNHDCQGKQEIKLVYANTVTGNITITRTNDSNLEIMHVIIPITGANIAITFPSDVRMARRYEVSSGDGWYQSTKILQVSSIGTADLHEFSLLRVGSTFVIQYDGPIRA